MLPQLKLGKPLDKIYAGSVAALRASLARLRVLGQVQTAGRGSSALLEAHIGIALAKRIHLESTVLELVPYLATYGCGH